MPLPVPHGARKCPPLPSPFCASGPRGGAEKGGGRWGWTYAKADSNVRMRQQCVGRSLRPATPSWAVGCVADGWYADPFTYMHKVRERERERERERRRAWRHSGNDSVEARKEIKYVTKYVIKYVT